MRKLFEFADKYITVLNWQKFSMIKFCLISLGVLIGILVPTNLKLIVGIVAGFIFACTYILIMAHFFKMWKANK